MSGDLSSVSVDRVLVRLRCGGQPVSIEILNADPPSLGAACPCEHALRLQSPASDRQTEPGGGVGSGLLS